MLRRFVVVAGILTAAWNACCTAPPNPVPTSTPGMAAAPAPMPMLQGRLRSPVFEANGFESSYGSHRYPKVHVPPTPLAEAPHATEAEAVDAAVAWIVAHFGPLPPDTTLVATSIDPTASGSPERLYDWDAGHTIVLHQAYRGTLTDIVSVVYIQGRSHVSGSFAVAALEPVPGSVEPVIAPSKAVEAIVQWARQHAESDDEGLAEFRARATPRLEYVWSPGADWPSAIYRATWVLIPNEPLMVDAHTGRVWIND